MYTPKKQSSSITVDQAFKTIIPKQNNSRLPTFKPPWYFIRFIGQPKIQFYAIKADYKTRQSSVAANSHVAVSRLHFFVKREAKIKTKSGWIFLYSTSLLNKILPTNLVACRPAFYTFLCITSEIHSTMRRCFVLSRPRTDLFCSFLLNLLQDKLHSFNIQGDRSMRFLCTTNYRIDYIIKLFHKENFIMSGLI